MKDKIDKVLEIVVDDIWSYLIELKEVVRVLIERVYAKSPPRLPMPLWKFI